jgi:condensin complex subunit 1
MGKDVVSLPALATTTFIPLRQTLHHRARSAYDTDRMADNFDINESLKLYLSDPTTIPTPEANPTLAECDNDPDTFKTGLIKGVLNPIIDAVAEAPDAIAQGVHLDTIQCLLKWASSSDTNYIIGTNHEPIARSSSVLPPHALGQVLDVIVSGLSAEADIVNNDLEVEEGDALDHHKQILEIYAFLLQWTIASVETKAAEKPASAPAARGKAGKGAKAKTAGKDGWDSAGPVQNAMEVMSKVLKLRLARIFTTTSERDTFVNLFTRAVYLVLESEVRVKSTPMRMHAFKVLCVAVKHHGHAYGKKKAT